MFRKIKDIAEVVKDTAVESTAKISEGAAVGIDKGKEYADAITEVVKDTAVESTAKISEGAAVGIDKGKEYADAITEVVKDAAAESTAKISEGAAVGIDKGKEYADAITEVVKDAAAESTAKISEGAAVGIDKGKEYADAIVIAALAVSETVRSSASYQKAMEVIQNPSAFSSAHEHLSKFRDNLDWSNIDPTKYRRAGMRGDYRGIAEAKRVWETIPEEIRASGSEETARYLKGKDWSHIEPYSAGGSDAAWNGIFESASDNRSRGNATMTLQDLEAAQGVLQSHAFHATLLESAQNAMKGGVISAVIIAVVAVLEYGLQYQKGEITEDEMYRAIGKSIAVAGISGAAVSGLITAMALAFPAIMPVLAMMSVPLMIIGFSVMGAKLVTLGKGWYEVYMNDQPLKPIALRYWMAKQYESVMDKTAGIATVYPWAERE